MTKAPNLPKLNVAQIDVVRVQTMNELAVAQAHLDEAAYAAALPDGDEKAMIVARDAVHILELKLGGLAAARKGAEEEENRHRELARAAERRKVAVEISVLISEHMSNMMGLGAAFQTLRGTIAKTDAFAELLRHRIFALGDEDQVSRNATQGALGALGAFAQANVPAKAAAMVKQGLDTAEFIIGGHDRAIAILSTLMPEFRDEETRAEVESLLDAKALEQFTSARSEEIARGEKAKADLASLAVK